MCKRIADWTWSCSRRRQPLLPVSTRQFNFGCLFQVVSKRWYIFQLRNTEWIGSWNPCWVTASNLKYSVPNVGKLKKAGTCGVNIRCSILKKHIWSIIWGYTQAHVSSMWCQGPTLTICNTPQHSTCFFIAWHLLHRFTMFYYVLRSYYDGWKPLGSTLDNMDTTPWLGTPEIGMNIYPENHTNKNK